MFDYIDENLEKIKNPNDVDIIKTADKDKGRSLYARINHGEAIPLTKPMSSMSYPWEPIYHLSKELGRFYWQDFSIIADDVAINKTHLVQLAYVDEKALNDKSKRVQIYADFDDGNLIYVARPLRKHFYKKWKAEIESKCGMEFVDITLQAKQENELKT